MVTMISGQKLGGLQTYETHCTIDSFYYSDVEEGQNDDEMEMPGRFESTKEASLLLFLGVFGQSWDVYSDIALSIQFANGEVTKHLCSLDFQSQFQTS